MWRVNGSSVLNFDELMSEVEQLNPDDWYECEEHFISQRDELESLRDLKTQFAVVGLFTVFEMFLRDTLQRLHRDDEANSEPRPPEPEPKRPKQSSFDDMKNAFVELGVPLTRPEIDWNAIKKLQAIRHCITHLGGIPDEEAAKILRGHHLNSTRGVPMQLPTGYFEDSAALIQRVCGRIC